METDEKISKYITKYNSKSEIIIVDFPKDCSSSHTNFSFEYYEEQSCKNKLFCDKLELKKCDCKLCKVNVIYMKHMAQKYNSTIIRFDLDKYDLYDDSMVKTVCTCKECIMKQKYIPCFIKADFNFVFEKIISFYLRCPEKYKVIGLNNPKFYFNLEDETNVHEDCDSAKITEVQCLPHVNFYLDNTDKNPMIIECCFTIVGITKHYDSV